MPQQLPLDALIARAAENPLALARLAGVLFNMGERARAKEIARKALLAAPDDAAVRSLVSGVLSQGVPPWHFSLVRDAARNAAYAAAIGRAVSAQTSVLEIGTGSGILAMMAARAGAKHVVTCETVPAIAEAAREIVALNGFADRVRVVAKKSHDLDPGADLGGLADVLISEIIGNTLVGEDALSATEHAVRVLLKPGAKVIPARGIIRVALAYDAKLHLARMDTIDGFDLSPFNRLATNRYGLQRGDARLTLMSTPADLFDFDFQSGGPFPAATAAKTLTSGGGRANGIAQWIALRMDESGWYENDPAPGTSSAWAVIFWPLPAPRDCPRGTTIEVWGSHDRHHLQIWA
jgi:type II protein arginine methyltransferase